jgi:DNA-binding NarL/FixJ family response regulator
VRAIRFLIADDHPVVRAGLRTMLTTLVGHPAVEFEVVGEAATGQQAIDLVSQLQPDIVLRDVRMPGIDGIAATSIIRKQRPQTAVLIMTTYENETDIRRALEAGAVGYLLKDTSQQFFQEAIEEVIGGGSALAPEVTRKLLNSLQSERTEERLSEREIEVLTLAARGESNKSIARHLHISEATVKTHLVRIFSRLGVEDRTAAVVVAIQRGLLHLDPPT